MIQEGSEDPWARTECQSGLHWQTAGGQTRAAPHTLEGRVPLTTWCQRCGEDEARMRPDIASGCLPSHFGEGSWVFYVG